MSGRPENLEKGTPSHEQIIVRDCAGVAEFDACVRLQREAFGLPDLELSPRRHLIVSNTAGGWTLGAFSGERLVGFVHHLVAVRGEEVIGYSHMMAVAKDFQNRGVGAQLKWAQRARALAEGRTFIKWTWDPMQARNAHFNLNRLGVTVSSYAVNFYGTDYSTLAGEFGVAHGIDSDRLMAGWDLCAPRVESLAGGSRLEPSGEASAAIEIPPDWGALVRENPETARREQLRVREEFRRALAAGLVCRAFARDAAHPRYLFYSDEG